ncbi:MAG: DNA translocase FtsK, partial [Polyangia bacterium]
VVTMYEFVPAPGTKLSKISALSNDLAMSLQALRVRIVAPIPGKGSVGIEVPNKTRATVYLKEVLVDEHVQKAKSKLTIGLGKDIAGAPVAVDLAKMPHLLVAGTTGSGKSVAVNGMICSILFNSTPEEVRMIMIDPKMVELSIYEGIPHLLLPVVTDPKKANLALRWAVDEMERRYEAVSKSGVRDILAYNKKIEKLLAEGPPKLESKKIKIYVEGDDGNKSEVEVSANENAVREAGGVVDAEVRDEISAANAAMQKAQQEAPPPPRKLPYIVVIIDEFADLMMVAPKDVETSVARIAQKARAVGIHLLLATQRPSVDVITGLIKANFPSRIAFQVASKIDSRTILDQQGAENLLGMGDMLFTDRGQALRRVHGALVTDVEIKRMVDFLKLQGQPVYDMDILKPRGDEEGDGEGGGGLPEEGDDPLYDQAVRLVCETRMASVSMIQRRLQIGFNRASRLVERMERDGIVGAPNGSKPREVLAQAI